MQVQISICYWDCRAYFWRESYQARKSDIVLHGHKHYADCLLLQYVNARGQVKRLLIVAAVRVFA